jgi:hypothetical protein
MVASGNTYCPYPLAVRHHMHINKKVIYRIKIYKSMKTKVQFSLVYIIRFYYFIHVKTTEN